MITIKITDKKPLTEFGSYEIMSSIQRSVKLKSLYNMDKVVEFSAGNIGAQGLKDEIKRLFFKPQFIYCDENTIKLWFKEVLLYD